MAAYVTVFVITHNHFHIDIQTDTRIHTQTPRPAL